jgi:DNA-binding GntR family transcriptional regulator
LAKLSAIKSGGRGAGSRAFGGRAGGTLLVERRSLAEQAAQILRQGILDGRFLPGSRLLETWLAEQMHLSRGTVRTALRELTHEGLVRAIPYTGWEVAALTLKDARELCTVRATLEALAARLAAEAISPEKIATLNVAYDRLVEAARRGNHRQCVENDLALHKTIFEMTGNDLLIGLYERIGQQIRMFVAFSDLRSDSNEFITWHAALVKSIKDGDAAAAERIAAENANRNGEELLAQLERNTAAQAGKGVATAARSARHARRGRG